MHAMPSPSIPRSISQPTLSRRSRRSQLPASTTRSTISAPAKSSLVKTVRKLHISRNNHNNGSNNSDLTEENLEEHNRRQQYLDHDKIPKSSPYYKGLIDASLSINRQKLAGPSPSSPARESQATTNATSLSFSSVLFKMKEWSSCFTFKSKIKNNNDYPETAAPPPTIISAPELNTERTTDLCEEVFERNESEVLKERGSNVSLVVDEEKPLRESVTSKQPPQPAPPPPVIYAPNLNTKQTTDLREEVFERNESEVLKERGSTSSLVVDEEKPLRERVTSKQPPQPASPPLLPAKTKRVDFKTEKEERVSDQKFIWADKYRPKALENFICNRDKALQLQTMVKSGECGHFIFEGLAGVGKRTMVWAFLRETFGPDNTKTWEECQQFKLKGESVGSINVNMKKSSQHVEVNLSDLKGYEKHIIVELIKEQHNRVVSNKKFQYGQDCRAIILYEADKLSTDVQLYISWLLERYKLGYNKIFFCCSDVSKLQPIKSLCTIVQLLPPSNEEIVQVLEFIAKQEGIELPHQLAEKIAENSKHNLRQAIRSFEASWQINHAFKENQVIMTGWEDDIATVAKNIVEEQSPKQLYIIRGKLQKLIEHNVSALFIFKTLKEELKKHLDEQFHPKIKSLYEEYNSNDHQSVLDSDNTVFSCKQEEMGKKLNDQPNVHLFMRIEEFIAKFMSWYKFSVINTKP